MDRVPILMGVLSGKANVSDIKMSGLFLQLIAWHEITLINW